MKLRKNRYVNMLPVDRVVGPALPPQDWKEASGLVMEAMRLAAAEGNQAEAQGALDAAYKAFALTLERGSRCHGG